MSNFKINPLALSQRSKNILEKPSFYQENLEERFGVKLDSSDKILTVFHRGNRAELAFLLEDVLCLFVQNKRLADLFKLNIREIESFLRDENHLPATDFSFEDLEKTLKSSMVSLLACALKSKLTGRIPLLSEQLRNWDELSLVEKNHWAQELFGSFSCQLVLAESKQITLSEVPVGLEEKQLEELLGDLFGTGTKLLTMKVVAVQ